ncbi:coiled-coil domain-containing protein 78 [Ambystoma mexicanum]|uniref:coiled-coil domain-containing protein 78 n=1 Tax=Ambystoma mexicanum TaxID=8296 RepID=UPI0037E8802A
MNVDIVGRVWPSRQVEKESSLHYSGSGRTISTAPGGEGLSFSFQEILDGHTPLVFIFSRTLEPLLGAFVEGMNVTLMTLGETDSRKSQLLTGDKTDRAGLVLLTVQHLYQNLLTSQRLATVLADSLAQKLQPGDVSWTLSMTMYEIYNEVLKDLLQVPGSAATSVELAYSAQEGVHLRGLSQVTISSASDAMAVFRNGWARRTGMTNYAPTAGQSSTVINFYLQVRLRTEPYPTHSWLKIVDLPGAENLTDDAVGLRSRELPMMNKSLLAFYRVVNELAGSPYADRVINYSDSTLTQLLEDALGGNCKTRVICCLPPNPEPRRLAAILKTCTALSQVKNFPILNDYYMESLLIQCRARILALQQRPPHERMENRGDGEGVSTLKEQVGRLTNENVQLLDRNERLYVKLGELQEKMGKLAGSKTDLSSKLIFSEEEKLKISKDLIDLQIETNQMREHYEAETFELKNMILSLENHVMELELQREKLSGEHDSALERLRAVETNRKELADEYIVLKSNYLALSKEHEREVSKNDELSMELLNLASVRGPPPQPPQDTYMQSRALVNEASAELERVRAMVNRLSARKIKPEEVVASEHERRRLEKNLLGNQSEVMEEIERMKKTHETQQQKVEERVVAMGKELQEAKKAIRNTQHKMAEQSASLLTSQSQLKELESENSRLQLQLKELNEEYRSRLSRYIRDLAEYVDGTSGMAHGTGKGAPDQAHMKRFVDSMLKDIRTSHKSREEQLAAATRGYKKRTQNVLKRHESLLIAYRMQREQILAQESNEMDPGPPEHHFTISDTELLSSTTQELNRLREDKARLETQIQELKEKVRLGAPSGWGFNAQQSGVNSKPGEEGWAEIRKQLREFTHNTQEDLEKERGQLMTRAIVAEEQLAELQEYVDKHLARYKQEILRLRKLLGSEAPRAFSADTMQAHLPHEAKRVTSYEL